MKSRVLKSARHYVINHTCQARSPWSTKLLVSVVGPFLPCLWFPWICALFRVICMCVSVFLGQFASSPRRPQVSHLQYLMWALIRGEELPNMLTTCWLRSHTQTHAHTGPSSDISQGARKGCIHHSDRARMERDIPLLSSHTHALSEIYSTRL